MRDKTILPTNLLDWPRVAGRLPEEKLILVSCWIGGGWMRSCGCGLLPLLSFAATLGFSPEAARMGLRNLAEPGVELLAMDEGTGEVFVMDWFRFHTFKSGVGTSILARDIQKTVSEPLKKLILEKSKTCLPTATATATATFSALAEKRGALKFSKKLNEAGVHLWTQSDELEADELVAKFGLEATRNAVSHLDSAGVKPLPSRVRIELEKKARKISHLPEMPFFIDPCAALKGEEIYKISVLKKQKPIVGNEKGA